MATMSAAHVAAVNAVASAQIVLAQGQPDGPVGPEFGKAAPIGLLVLVIAAVFVLALGWAFYRRHSHFQRRRMFADAHGIDVFDEEALDQAMAEAGVLDRKRKRFI